MNVRVLLVEDHELVRSGIKTMLEKDPRVQVVGGAANGAEGVELASELRPDVVLMDIEMPVLNGIEAARQIVRELPDTKVITHLTQRGEQGASEGGHRRQPAWPASRCCSLEQSDSDDWTTSTIQA